MFDFDLQHILYILPGIIIGLSFHEFAHAYLADRFGDPTPRSQGRLTLSPISHIDPIGFILFVVVGFGWAKPVQINPRNLRSPRANHAIISIAGPMTNLLLSIVLLLVCRIFSMTIADSAQNTIINSLFWILYFGASINITLTILNLLPIPGFDGFHFLMDILPYKISNKLSSLDRYFYVFFLGFIVLINIFDFFDILVTGLFTILSGIIGINPIPFIRL